MQLRAIVQSQTSQNKSSCLCFLCTRGVMGLFESHLPVRGPAPRPQFELWMRPLFIIVVVGVAYWQFTRSRWSVTLALHTLLPSFGRQLKLGGLHAALPQPCTCLHSILSGTLSCTLSSHHVCSPNLAETSCCQCFCCSFMSSVESASAIYCQGVGASTGAVGSTMTCGRASSRNAGLSLRLSIVGSPAGAWILGQG